MRWPSESCRTGVARNGASSSRSRALVEPLGGAPAVDPVEVAQEIERVGERQVPPQQRTLPEHHADAAGEFDALADGTRPHTCTAPLDGTSTPVHILIVVDLPGAVRPDVPDHLAGAIANDTSSTACTTSRVAPDAAAAPPAGERLVDAGEFDDVHAATASGAPSRSGRRDVRGPHRRTCARLVTNRCSGSDGRRRSRRARDEQQRHDRDERAAVAEERREPERVGLVEHVQRRAGRRRTRAGSTYASSRRNHGPNTVERVRRHLLAAVGERVRELGAADEPERHARADDEHRSEDRTARHRHRRRSSRTRPTSHWTSAAPLSRSTNTTPDCRALPEPAQREVGRDHLEQRARGPQQHARRTARCGSTPASFSMWPTTTSASAKPMPEMP